MEKSKNCSNFENSILKTYQLTKTVTSINLINWWIGKNVSNMINKDYFHYCSTYFIHITWDKTYWFLFGLTDLFITMLASIPFTSKMMHQRFFLIFSHILYCFVSLGIFIGFLALWMNTLRNMKYMPRLFIYNSNEDRKIN